VEAASGRRPTIADVAHRAGVSKATVSFALNERPGVSEQTRRRILRAVEELGWTPSTRARALSHSRSFALGLVLARPAHLLGADPFFPPFIAGVESVLQHHGYALVIQVVGEDGDREPDSYRRLAREGRVDGVFLTDLRRDDPRFGLLARLGLPAVAVGCPATSCDLPWVAVDDRPGVEEAVEHLVRLGHRRIAHVSGPSRYVHSASRLGAVRGVLERAGREPAVIVRSDFTAPGGAAATKDLLHRPEAPTAIVYANDLMAMAGVGAIHDAGLRVPGDVSVVGFDDMPLAGHLDPPLTTVRHDVLGWGAAAAETLLAVAGEHASGPTGWIGRAELIVRGSTGAPGPDARPEPTDDAPTH
jgi:DNA-binding LacI/PurR family transcriptional regulator